MKAMADCLIVPKAAFRANERFASERINKMNHFEWLTTQQLLKLGMESGELRSLPLFSFPVNELIRRKM
ncbi:hypothetical protein BLX87_23470 [Bacillus sp. VT-16-64]|nr:hypothetical protein BLX87_23470 [Bacillus sp. VT-16-64]